MTVVPSKLGGEKPPTTVTPEQIDRITQHCVICRLLKKGEDSKFVCLFVCLALGAIVSFLILIMYSA